MTFYISLAFWIRLHLTGSSLLCFKSSATNLLNNDLQKDNSWQKSKKPLTPKIFKRNNISAKTNQNKAIPSSLKVLTSPPPFPDSLSLVQVLKENLITPGLVTNFQSARDRRAKQDLNEM